MIEKKKKKKKILEILNHKFTRIYCSIFYPLEHKIRSIHWSFPKWQRRQFNSVSGEKTKHPTSVSLFIKNRVNKELLHNQQKHIINFIIYVLLKIILALSKFEDIMFLTSDASSHHYIQTLFKLFTKLTYHNTWYLD